MLTLCSIQYIANRLLAINEFGKFKPVSAFAHPPNATEDEKKALDAAKKAQDDEIFHRTRLVNCGYFMHIILGDYVGAILGLVRDGSDWRLDPLMVRFLLSLSMCLWLTLRHSLHSNFALHASTRRASILISKRQSMGCLPPRPLHLLASFLLKRRP